MGRANCIISSAFHVYHITFLHGVGSSISHIGEGLMTVGPNQIKMFSIYKETLVTVITNSTYAYFLRA